MKTILRERIRIIVACFSGAYFIWMAYMLLTPQPPVPEIGSAIDFLHLGAFGALGVGVGLSRRKWSTKTWRFALLGWAVGSECLQFFTGRCFEFIDIFQNVVGILLGLEVGRLIREATRKKSGDDAAKKGENRVA